MTDEAMPTPEQQVQLMADLVAACERAALATRHLLWAVAVLGVGNIALVCAVIALVRRG